MMAALPLPKSTSPQFTLPNDNFQNGTKVVPRNYSQHRVRRDPTLIDPEPRLRVPHETTMLTIPPIDFAHTQSPAIPVTPRHIEEPPNSDNEPTTQSKLQAQVTIGETTYRVRNPWARYQDICRNALHLRCAFGLTCHRLHLSAPSLPQEHLDIIHNHPERIKVTKTNPPPPATNSVLNSSPPVSNEPIQAVVKLPSPHIPAKPPTYPLIAASFRVLQALEAPAALAAKKPAPVIEPPPPSQSTTRPPKDPPPHQHQALTSMLPGISPATSNSRQPIKTLNNTTQPLRKDSTPTVESFYSRIYADDDSGFWGWKSDDKDAWDDTGQSSSDVSIDTTSTDINSSRSSFDELPEEHDRSDSLPNRDRSGTLPCTDRIRGRCRCGSSCLFAHVSPPGLAARPTPPVAPPLPPGLYSRPSPAIALAVPQANLPPRLTPPDHALRARLGDEGVRDRDLCRDWVRGRCFLRERCRFAHITPPGIPPPHSSNYTNSNQAESSSSRLSSSRTAPPSTVSGAGPASVVSSRRSAPLSTISAGSITRYAISENKTETHTVTSLSATNSTVWNVRVLEHNRLQMGPGFVVEKLMTGFETPFVLLEGIPSNVSTTLLTKTLSEYGRVMDIRPTGVQGRNHRVKFGSAKEAQDVISELNGSIVFDRKISARLFYLSGRTSVNGIFTDTVVFVKWEVPGKYAYGGYDSMSQASRAISAALNAGYHAVHHVGLPAVGMHTVRFFGIPVEADKEWMSRFGAIDDVMWEEEKYTDIDRARKAIYSRLTMDDDVIEFDVIPGQKDGFLRGFAYFLSPEQAKAACTRLNGWRPSSIGKARIFAQHKQEVSYSVPSVAFSKISNDISALQQSILSRDDQRIKLSIIHKGPPGLSDFPVKIRLSGDDLKELVQYKTEFEQILRGEIVRENGRLVWDRFFRSRDGVAMVHDLEHNHIGVSIEVDIVRQNIVLYGSAEKRAAVRQLILDQVHQLRRTKIFHLDIHLDHMPSLFKSPDMDKLMDELGRDNIWFELKNPRVMIRGDLKALALAKEAVVRTQERRMKSQSNRPYNIAACPACLDAVSLPVTLNCGHSWCRDCLGNYLKAAVDGGSFPLSCFGNQGKCSEPIPLGIARDCLQVHDFDALVRASYFSYVHSRPKEFHYCPTPDCQEIYRTASKGTVLQCPSCLQRTCPFCHVEYHEGAPCPDRDENDKMFKQWMKDHDVKNCPGCRVPIERGEGCNHITCTRCQTHICWVCLETFPRGDGIYEHMRTMHGGIGLRADGL